MDAQLAAAARYLEMWGREFGVASRRYAIAAIGSDWQVFATEAIADLERQVRHVDRCHAIFRGKPLVFGQQKNAGVFNPCRNGFLRGVSVCGADRRAPQATT